MKTANIAIVSLLCLFFSGLSFAQEPLELHFIDVGEGDAVLVQYKNNNLLIDTGNLLSGYKLVDYLIKNKVSEIKYLIITHPHPHQFNQHLRIDRGGVLILFHSYLNPDTLH